MGVRYVVTDKEFKEPMTFRTLKEALSDAEDCKLNGRGFVVVKETFSREDISKEVEALLAKRTAEDKSDE